ncbi:hypothetical protein ACE14D_18310 [Streptomyces sp. Act-28]
MRVDKAYGSRANRSRLRRRGVKAMIPIPADRIRDRWELGSRGGRPPVSDKTRHRERHAVERGVDRPHRLKHHRAVATGHNEPATRHEAAVLVAVREERL